MEGKSGKKTSVVTIQLHVRKWVEKELVVKYGNNFRSKSVVSTKINFKTSGFNIV